MWVDFHKILAKHLYAFNMFLLVRIRLILTVVKFVCDVWMMACIKQLIWYTKNKNIVYVMLLSLHYLKSFHLFSRKPLNFKNTKTNFVRSSTNTRQHNNHTWHVVIYEAKRTYKIIGCEKGMLNFFLVAWKCRLKSNINALSHIPPPFRVSSIFDK